MTSNNYWYFTVSLLALAGWPGASVAAPMPSLPSMEVIMLEVQQRPHHFGQVAHRVNSRLHSPQDAADVADALSLPGLDQVLDTFLNDKGQVTLPLGIRVYDTLGDPSVGFGADL